jgi:hypothetical protein
LAKIENIQANLGIGGQYNRESIAAGMGYSSLNGSSARVVAALAQYGLLSRVKDLYSLSDEAIKYLLPTSDNDQLEVIQEAATTPPLFADIYTVFKGQVLPKHFLNRLIQEFDIEQKVASDVERIFKATMTTAGILKTNGILEISAPTQSTVAAPASNASVAEEPESVESVNLAPTNYLSVELPSGLIVSYSQDLASEFAFGTFGQELKALNDAVAKHLRAQTETKAEEEV